MNGVDWVGRQEDNTSELYFNDAVDVRGQKCLAPSAGLMMD